MIANKTRLAVVLLNYRTPEMVLACLDTLLPQALDTDSKVVVVDNCSGDQSLDLIARWIEENSASHIVSLIPASHNGGFSSGNNVGIQNIDAEFYMLLNSDTLLRENALENMLNAISEDDNIGLLSPRLEWPDETPQESCFRYHRPISQLIDSSGTGLVLKLLSRFEVAKRVSDIDSDCEWTSFACVVVRKKVFDQIGILDDQFFMYFEDVEFCHRAKKAGWSIRNCPSARVVHLRGGSSPVKTNIVERKRQARYFYESRTLYFYKVFGHAGLFSANILWTLGWMLANIRSLLQKGFKPPACELEWKDIWTNFLHPDAPYIHPEKYK